jgi:transcriptional regulator with PAS, ATPase and Fis domain
MELELQQNSYEIIGQCDAIRKVLDLAQKAAISDSTVMISGESGTGKELIARALHKNSPRAKNSFIPVNCAAIPHDLLESELFGYEKGAFTGAVHTKIGRLELAHNGTILLDEIGDMPPTLQVKLLRVLAEREIDRIGGSRPIKIDIRVVAATHHNLEELIEKGKFREDLYYRLNVIPISMPPLRERKPDIPVLIDHYIKYFNESKNKSIQGMNEGAMEILKDYRWPGNIRELVNFVERMVVLSSGNVLTVRDLPEKALVDIPEEKLEYDQEPQYEAEENPAEILRQSLKKSFFVGLPEEGMNLKQAVEDFEREMIIEALEKTNSVKNKAAGLLGLNRTTLVEKIKKLNIK